MIIILRSDVKIKFYQFKFILETLSLATNYAYKELYKLFIN